MMTNFSIRGLGGPTVDKELYKQRMAMYGAHVSLTLPTPRALTRRASMVAVWCCVAVLGLCLSCLFYIL